LLPGKLLKIKTPAAAISVSGRLRSELFLGFVANPYSLRTERRWQLYNTYNNKPAARH
jgi:hypothetical protein